MGQCSVLGKLNPGRLLLPGVASSRLNSWRLCLGLWQHWRGEERLSTPVLDRPSQQGFKQWEQRVPRGLRSLLGGREVTGGCLKCAPHQTQSVVLFLWGCHIAVLGPFHRATPGPGRGALRGVFPPGTASVQGFQPEWEGREELGSAVLVSSRKT